MKNELTPWEVGLAEQVKGKEFSFDPQAFADFENLLEAETLGQEPGHQAPKAAGEMMSAGGIAVSLPMILLAIGLACLAGWWFLPGEAEVLVEPAVTTSVPTTLPAPATNIAPAAPPTPTVRTESNELSDVRGQISNSPDLTSSNTSSSTVLVAEEEGSIRTDEKENTPYLPRVQIAASRVATLPIAPVVPLRAATISLPTVQKPTPINPKRDRKALFPDVIKKN
jgi:hypothetical protein